MHRQLGLERAHHAAGNLVLDREFIVFRILVYEVVCRLANRAEMGCDRLETCFIEAVGMAAQLDVPRHDLGRRHRRAVRHRPARSMDD